MTSAPPTPQIPLVAHPAAVTLPWAAGPPAEPVPPADRHFAQPAQPPRRGATTDTTHAVTSILQGRHAQRLATALYVVAASGSWIGQMWAGAISPLWPDDFPVVLRLLILAPFAAVVDLGSVSTMALADWRRSQGENATYWRIVSFAWLGVAVGINVVGHIDQIVLAVGFGALGVGAFAVAVGHIEARRRDALKALGLLPRDKPRYGDELRQSEPEAVRLAERLYFDSPGLDKWDALEQARAQIRTTRHRDALAAYLKEQMAQIHTGDSTLPGIISGAIRFDLLADRVMQQVDLDAWAMHIGQQLSPPSGVDDDIDSARDLVTVDVEGLLQSVPGDLLKRMPNDPDSYAAWRWLWAASQYSKEKLPTFARQHGISERQMHWIRNAGRLRLLDSPQPPIVQVLQHAHMGGDVDWSELANQPAPKSVTLVPQPPTRQSAAAGPAR